MADGRHGGERCRRPSAFGVHRFWRLLVPNLGSRRGHGADGGGGTVGAPPDHAGHRTGPVRVGGLCVGRCWPVLALPSDSLDRLGDHADLPAAWSRGLFCQRADFRPQPGVLVVELVYLPCHWDPPCGRPAASLAPPLAGLKPTNSTTMTTISSVRSLASPWRKELVILYVVALLAGTAVGLYNPVISIQMKEVGFSDTVIGAASSLFFLGVILVAPMAGYVARRRSLRAVLAIGLVLAGIGSMLFPMAQSLAHWILFRIILAAGIGFYLIGGQSAIHTFSPEENRSLASGLYALFLGWVWGWARWAALFYYPRGLSGPFMGVRCCFGLAFQ
jgi:hypothetical protein